MKRVRGLIYLRYLIPVCRLRKLCSSLASSNLCLNIHETQTIANTLPGQLIWNATTNYLRLAISISTHSITLNGFFLFLWLNGWLYLTSSVVSSSSTSDESLLLLKFLPHGISLDTTQNYFRVFEKLDLSVAAAGIRGGTNKCTIIVRHVPLFTAPLPSCLANHNKHGDLQAGRQIVGYFSKTFSSVSCFVFIYICIVFCFCFISCVHECVGMLSIRVRQANGSTLAKRRSDAVSYRAGRCGDVLLL